MEAQERIEICRTCKRRSLHKDLGLICGITRKKPNFEETQCPEYLPDDVALERVKNIEEYRPEETPGSNFIILAALVFGYTLISLALSWFKDVDYKSWLIPLGLFILLEAIKNWISPPKLTAKKLNKIILEYLYDNGFSIQKFENRIVFVYKKITCNLNFEYFHHQYFIHICSEFKRLNEEKMGSAKIISELAAIDIANRSYHFVKAMKTDNGIEIICTFKIENSKVFNKEFPYLLEQVRKACDCFNIEYEDYIKQLKPATD